MATRFDTLALTRALERAGMDRKASEEITTAIADALTQTTATSQDLKDAETGIRRDMLDGFSKVHVEIASLKGDNVLIKWMMGVIVAGVASLVIKSFF